MRLLTKVLVVSILTSSALFSANIPDAPKDFPKGELGRMVKLGEEIMRTTDTHQLTKDYVGNKLQCTSCHLKGSDGLSGTAKGIGTFIGTAVSFPAYSKREKSVQTLQNRINNCFMRSMNGVRPIIDTEASVAMATYVRWLSTGLPINLNEKAPTGVYNTKRWIGGFKKLNKIQKKATHENYLAGQNLYSQKCASCHGKNGEGVGKFPPVWGKGLAYNTGAGMSKLGKGARWVQSNMPLHQGDTLSDQEAADVMLYVNAQERDDFDLEKGLLPRDKMGHYNSKVLKEKHSVRSNFKAMGLDVDVIRGDKKIK